MCSLLPPFLPVVNSGDILQEWIIELANNGESAGKKQKYMGLPLWRSG